MGDWREACTQTYADRAAKAAADFTAAQQDSKRVSRMAAENWNGGGVRTDGHMARPAGGRMPEKRPWG